MCHKLFSLNKIIKLENIKKPVVENFKLKIPIFTYLEYVYNKIDIYIKIRSLSETLDA